jgi:hypothetical protein
MRHEELPPIGRAEYVVACKTGDGGHRTEAILRLALHDGDPSFIEQAIVALFDDDDVEVRRGAVLSVGHLARLHGRVTEETLARLRALELDPALAGTVSDALDDVAIFTRPQLPMPTLDKVRHFGHDSLP